MYLYQTLLLYDITNVRSLDKIPEWIQIIRSNNKYNVPNLLVGNKLDLEAQREVTQEQINQFKEENHISDSIEMSLKTDKLHSISRRFIYFCFNKN